MSLRVKTFLVSILVVTTVFFLVSDFMEASSTLKNKKAHISDLAQIGDVSVRLIGPDNLQRVDGLNQAADEFIKSREEKMKLRVLAIYADPAEWHGFVENLKNKKEAGIKNIALICEPIKLMDLKFDDKAWRKETRRYKNWFSFAINTRPVTYLLNSKLEKKVKKSSDPEVTIQYMVDKNSGKFFEDDKSISFGTPIETKLFGQKQKLYLAITSMRLADKLLFLAYAGDGADSNDKVADLQNNLGQWRDKIWATNI